MEPETLSAWLAYLERLHPKSIALGLDRVSEVKRRLQLEPTFPVVLVGGTNGKGSTCAMLEAVLSSAGYRVGCYTSPHLLRYNERVRVNRVMATDAQLCAAFAAVEAVRGDVALTYFEFGTLAAMWFFAASQIDVAVLEVGLGGRLDAVNIFAPVCSIVTSVALDHMEYLGNDRDAIGFEKAGIYRAGKPALFAGADAPATLERHAAAIGADFMKLDQDFGYTKRDHQWDFWGRRGKHHCLPYPALRGSYQLHNAAGCVAALDELSEVLPVTLQDIKQGLLSVDLPGRLQVVPGRPTVILDVAHNPHAAGALAENLAAISGPGLTYGVFAMLKDKDIAGVISAIGNRVDRWLLASIAAPRGASAQQVQSELRGLGLGEGEIYDSPAAAFSAACRRARQDDRILVFGSFYTVAGVLQQLHQPGAGKDP